MAWFWHGIHFSCAKDSQGSVGKQPMRRSRLCECDLSVLLLFHLVFALLVASACASLDATNARRGCHCGGGSLDTAHCGCYASSSLDSPTPNLAGGRRGCHGSRSMEAAPMPCCRMLCSQDTPPSNSSLDASVAEDVDVETAPSWHKSSSEETASPRPRCYGAHSLDTSPRFACRSSLDLPPGTRSLEASPRPGCHGSRSLDTSVSRLQRQQRVIRRGVLRRQSAIGCSEETLLSCCRSNLNLRFKSSSAQVLSTAQSGGSAVTLLTHSASASFEGTSGLFFCFCLSLKNEGRTGHFTGVLNRNLTTHTSSPCH